MSRRCDVMGVPWPRIGYTTEGVADALLGRLWSLTVLAPGAWDDAADARCARGRDHDRALVNLRERVVLP